MQYDFFSHAFLFLSIVATVFLFYKKKFYIFGIVSISICLLFFDFPDIAEYREHYEFAGQAGYDYVSTFYNFEPGYVLLVAISASLIPFEAFYVLIISSAIYAYLRFFEETGEKNRYIYATIFLSICLYFIAFTLRTTISSTFLAFAVTCMQKKRNTLAFILILVGSLFHVVILATIILPFVSLFSRFISRYFILILPFAGIFSLIIGQYFDLNAIVGYNNVLDLKISSYTDANISSNTVFLGMWLIALATAFASFKKLDEFERALIIAFFGIIVVLIPYEFIQGRFMWLTSFLFAYILSKGTFIRFNLTETGGIVFMTVLPLAVFFRL
jgi:EpsG family